MNNKRVEINKNGVRINVELIGFFRIPELEKEYAMYSIADNDETNENASVMLGEVIRNEKGEIAILDIKKEEIDLVLAFYNEISTQLGGK